MAGNAIRSNVHRIVKKYCFLVFEPSLIARNIESKASNLDIRFPKHINWWDHLQL